MVATCLLYIHLRMRCRHQYLSGVLNYVVQMACFQMRHLHHHISGCFSDHCGHLPKHLACVDHRAAERRDVRLRGVVLAMSKSVKYAKSCSAQLLSIIQVSFMCYYNWRTRYLHVSSLLPCFSRVLFSVLTSNTTNGKASMWRHVTEVYGARTCCFQQLVCCVQSGNVQTLMDYSLLIPQIHQDANAVLGSWRTANLAPSGSTTPSGIAAGGPITFMSTDALPGLHVVSLQMSKETCCLNCMPMVFTYVCMASLCSSLQLRLFLYVAISYHSCHSYNPGCA